MQSLRCPFRSLRNESEKYCGKRKKRRFFFWLSKLKRQQTSLGNDKKSGGLK